MSVPSPKICAARLLSAAPDSRWPDASAPLARLRMDVAAVQLLLVTSQVFVSEYVPVLWNKTTNKDDKELTSVHRSVRRRTVWYLAMD